MMMIACKSGLRQVCGFLQIYVRVYNTRIFVDRILTKLCVTNTYRFMECYTQMEVQWRLYPV